MNKYQVHLIEDAEKDILAIYHYIAANDSIMAAEQFLNKIEEQCYKLNHLPDRGHNPPELLRIDVLEYKEIYLKPYRILYQIIEHDVFIHGVFDSRRDMEDLLKWRLLRAEA